MIDDRELRAWLRRGDPARDGTPLPVDELQRLRRRVLAAAPEPRRRHRAPLAALAAAAALATVLLLLPMPPEAPERSARAEPSAPVPRRIQFTTERGTRVLWTLDPDFEL
jgi:hypothetical protein